VVIPYAAVIVFICGFVARLVGWAKSPAPFSIATTGGQQWSFDWIKSEPLDNPPTKGWAVARMIFEVMLFRSLFRNTSVHLHPGQKVRYNSAKWLWLFALLFHYSFLVIFIRHFRFFLEPVPFLITAVEALDGMFQMATPTFYQTDMVILLGVGFLLLRRFFDNKVRYISLMADYFPLFLILGVVSTGIWMRYLDKTDVSNIKVLTMGLMTFHPMVPADIAPIFFIHLFLVCSLLVYFPFSKLMHMGGVFMSPTRNLPNNPRFVRYVNPWNPPKKLRTYAEYEDEFREHMVEAGLPVDKQPES